MSLYSARFRDLPPLNRLTRRLRRLRSAGHAILDLTVTNPTRVGLDLPGDFLLKAAGDQRILKYTPEAAGSRRSREAIAEYYCQRGRQVRPDQILLTCSTSEAYSCLFKLLADPGQQILTPRPSYPLFEHLTRMESLDCRTYPLRYADGWAVDLADLRSGLFDPAVRALILVHPNNPTGSLIAPPEWAKVTQWCGRLRKPVIIDEVFFDFCFQDRRELEPDSQIAVPTFVLNGLSKLAALPQIKASWIVVLGPRAEAARARERLELILDTYLSVGEPAQQILQAALPRRRLRQAPLRRRLEENLTAVAARLEGAAAQLLRPAGGWMAVIRLPRVVSEEEWVLRLLEKRHILTHPGYFYEFEEEAFLVVSLLTPPEIMSRAIDGLLAELEDAG